MKIMKYIAAVTFIAGLIVRNMAPEVSKPLGSAKIDIEPGIEASYAEIEIVANGAEAEDKDISVTDIDIEETKFMYYDSDPSAYAYYSMLPADIRETFEASDWTWFVYDEAPLADKYSWNVALAGMTDWNRHEIVIDRRDESKEAILHEMGHWSIHYYHGGLQNVFINAVFDKEWEDLYNEFGGSKCNYDTVEEFGASAFEYYFLEPERLAKAAPYAYRLMDRFVNGDLVLTNMATDVSRTGTCVNTFEDSDGIEAQVEIIY